MSWGIGSRFPPRVALLLAVAVAVPPAALLWVCWRVLEQDRALEEQQVAQRVERAADIATAALLRAVESTERRLAEGAGDWPDGAVCLTAVRETLQVWPRERVSYLPAALHVPELPGAPFAAAESVEFGQRDLNRAATIYRDLASSDHADVRAGALLRLARCLRASGRHAEALPVYTRLLNEDGWAFEGMPVSLVARQARCSVMEVLKRTDELRYEAAALSSDLRRDRWPLTRPVAQLHAQDAARWGIALPPVESERELLAEGLAAIWQKVSQPGAVSSGREAIPAGQGETVVAIWNRSGERVTALVADSRFVSAQWLAAIDPVLREQRVDLTLYGDARALPGGAVRRAAETGLPWTVVVAASDPETEHAQFRLRRRLLLSGFLILAALAVVAGYLMYRALSREFAAARLQSEFVAAVSHEFRTPLTSLRQFTDMLRDHKNLTDERRDLCYEAQARSTSRLTRLVESLLDFGRMEGGARVYHFAPVDCSELVRRVVEEFRSESQSSGFQFCVAAERSVEIDADSEALGRALWNLLDNAVKYSGDSREVAVEVSRNDRKARITVQDRGLGIPAREQKAIFRKFQRGGDAVKLGIKGTGIGLAMVSHIVKAHHGRIELQSAPGQGSTFSIDLPVRG